MSADSLTDAIEAEQRDEPLRQALNRALRQLEQEKATRAELVDAVYRAARDTALTMTFPPIPVPHVRNKADKRNAEVAICLLADWQLGKKTPDYNSDVAAERVARYAEKVVSILELQRSHHPVNEARIYLLGDFVEGELIFPGQAHRIDASLYVQLFRGAEMLANLVRVIASAVPKVAVRGVIGNHGELGGRARREYHPESNADAILYNIARLQLAGEKRVDWAETLEPGERAWHVIDEVLGRRWFLWHGNQVKSASFGIPFYGFGKRLLGWATSIGQFEYSASGHWHQAARLQFNAITHWSAGSTESANTYAQEWIASGGQKPTQWLLFQGMDGISAEYEVRL